MFILFVVCCWCSILVNGQGFTTNNSNGNLIDANGNNFIMKGMSVPLAWYIDPVNNSIDDVRNNTNSNCLRIVVTTGTADNAWQTAVNNCIANKIVPMIELHDVTGNTDENELVRMGTWWASKATFLKSPDVAKYVLINLANEWGTWQTATSNGASWKNASINAIKKMRDAGIKTTIVIDAVGYGQDVDDAKNIRAYAKEIQSADAGYLGASANLLFSIHMYCEWAKGGDNMDIINTIKGSGIPIIVGEFGYQHANGGTNVCDIDEQAILNKCQSYGIGWLAWSQKGNGGGVEYLDLCTNWECSSLSGWGNTIVNGTNGTKTASTCTAFTNVPPPLGTNVALNKPVTVSGTEAGGILLPSNVNDGNSGTRWASVAALDNQFVIIDLSGSYKINDVVLKWESAYATDYSVEISSDKNSWTRLGGTTSGDGGNDLITNLSAIGRYIRVLLNKRFGATWGFSLYEIEVYGSPATHISSNTVESDFKVYPNPAHDLLTIEGNVTQGWRILNSVGVVVLEGTENTIDISQLSIGYYVLVSGSNHAKIIKK